jgi:phage gp16-like protein
MASGTTKNSKKKLIQLVHVGKSKLGWDDAAYRAFLYGVCGKESAADMSERQLKEALQSMRKLGFEQIPSRVKPSEKGRASMAQLEYIKGMWAKCARNKSEKALLQFVKRIAHVSALRFLDEKAAQDIILALRDMMVKAGYDPDTSEKIEDSAE